MIENTKLLLYILMRDELPVGKLHSIMAHHVRPIAASERPTIYSDKDLEQIAEKLALELTGAPERPEFPPNRIITEGQTQ